MNYEKQQALIKAGLLPGEVHAQSARKQLWKPTVVTVAAPSAAQSQREFFSKT